MIIIDNILKKEACSILIEYFESNKEHIKYWHGTEVLDMKGAEKKFLNKLQFIYTSYLNSKGLIICPELTQIVKWPVGTLKEPHLDTSRDTTKLTSITYLNNDYQGGKTCLDNGIEVLPKIGQTVFFDGMAHKHWVTEIKQKPRYTLAIWYTDNIDLIYT